MRPTGRVAIFYDVSKQIMPERFLLKHSVATHKCVECLNTEDSERFSSAPGKQKATLPKEHFLRMSGFIV